jgi:hypothetical protein
MILFALLPPLISAFRAQLYAPGGRKKWKGEKQKAFTIVFAPIHKK